MSKRTPKFELWIKGIWNEDILLCTTESEGLANLIAVRLGDVYSDIRIVKV